MQHLGLVLPVGVLLLLSHACSGQMQTVPTGAPTDLRLVGHSIFAVVCEQTDANAVAPYITTHIPADVHDFEACMSLCDEYGDTCEISFWDSSSSNPCMLLASVPVSETPTTPAERCYGTKLKLSPAGPVPVPTAESRPAESDILLSALPDLLPPETFADGFPSVPLATSTSTSSADSPVRTNALCGAHWTDIPDRQCPQQDPTWGSCCSAYGFCGNSSYYCGFGCQAGFGSCGEQSPAQPVELPSSPATSPAAPFAPLPPPLTDILHMWTAPPSQSLWWLPIFSAPAAPTPIIIGNSFGPTSAPEVGVSTLSDATVVIDDVLPSPDFPTAAPAPFAAPFDVQLPDELLSVGAHSLLDLLPLSTSAPADASVLIAPSPQPPRPPVVEPTTGALKSSALTFVA